jgi:hypothetical protein
VPVAAADAARKPAPYPSVSKIQPLNLGIGDTLTITGRNFVSGRNRNTVVFKRDGKRALFVKAGQATKTRLTVVIPERLRTALGRRNGEPVPSKFRVRVLSRRFAKRYSPRDSSPIIAPRSVRPLETVAAPAPTQPAPTPAAAPASPPPPPPDCDRDGLADDVDPDDDNDLLTDAFELSIRTNTCAADSDRDGMWDVWEYESAIDLNGRNALPYPGKRPHPNALDGSDANADWDGDGLLSHQEHALWQKFGRRALPLNYSDGLQKTGPIVPAPTDPSLAHLDRPHGWTGVPADGELSDDEKDADGDRLSNWAEANGQLQSSWWTVIKPFSEETPYFNVYDSTDYLLADSDGDGRRDGDDDQDFDGWNNVAELDRSWTGWFVHPFNPCLPNPGALRCSRYVPSDTQDKPYPPFNGELDWDHDFDPDTAEVAEPWPLQWPAPSADPANPVPLRAR